MDVKYKGYIIESNHDNTYCIIDYSEGKMYILNDYQVSIHDCMEFIDEFCMY